MKLFKLSQEKYDGYDTFDSCVVCAENEQKARLIHPSEFVTHSDENNWYGTNINGGEYITEDNYPTWVRRNEIDLIKVEYLGEADKKIKKGLIVASFNAG